MAQVETLDKNKIITFNKKVSRFILQKSDPDNITKNEDGIEIRYGRKEDERIAIIDSRFVSIFLDSLKNSVEKKELVFGDVVYFFALFWSIDSIRELASSQQLIDITSKVLQNETITFGIDKKTYKINIVDLNINFFDVITFQFIEKILDKLRENIPELVERPYILRLNNLRSDTYQRLRGAELIEVQGALSPIFKTDSGISNPIADLLFKLLKMQIP